MILAFAGLGASCGVASAFSVSFATPCSGSVAAANLFTVPAGVSTVSIVATASPGQDAPGGDASGGGGSGDVVSGALPGLGGGQTLAVCVGSGGGAAGRPGSSGAGGGASGVGLGSDFSQPVLIAAGGGGGGGGAEDAPGGSAGLPAGAAGGGLDASAPGGAVAGGRGGTQTAGGVGGTAVGGGAGGPGAAGAAGAALTAAGPGAGGAGGKGGPGGGGGGGGAGYFGGGGGGAFAVGGGGGGGSDFCGSVISGCAVVGQNGVFGAASVTFTWRVTTQLSATPLLALGSLGSVSATLRNAGDGTPVAGKPISFATSGGATLCSATTNATGTATCPVSLTIGLRALLAGGYTATFAGDSDYLPSSASAGLL